jgi:hypothetical protein
MPPNPVWSPKANVRCSFPLKPFTAIVAPAKEASNPRKNSIPFKMCFPLIPRTVGIIKNLRIHSWGYNFTPTNQEKDIGYFDNSEEARALKVGFTKEGTIRKSVNGVRRDSYLYSILREEWKEPKILTKTA